MGCCHWAFPGPWDKSGTWERDLTCSGGRALSSRLQLSEAEMTHSQQVKSDKLSIWAPLKLHHEALTLYALLMTEPMA